nr:unnamed protein product [Spirometra erinaceieuropaei]
MDSTAYPSVVNGARKDNLRSNQPEPRTVLVVRELARYNVDNAAFSETRFYEQGQQEEGGACYTFFWSGRPKAERRDADVASAIRSNIDWFDDSDAATSNSLAEKSRPHNAYVNRPTDDNEAVFYCSHHLVQMRLREMQEALMARKAEKTQGYANRKEWRNFLVTIKAVYSPTAKGTAPLPSANGSTQLTEQTKILHRWTEHFRGVLNRPSIISDAAITHLPQVETNALSTRNHEGRTAALQQEGDRIGRLRNTVWNRHGLHLSTKL